MIRTDDGMDSSNIFGSSMKANNPEASCQLKSIIGVSAPETNTRRCLLGSGFLITACLYNEVDQHHRQRVLFLWYDALDDTTDQVSCRPASS